MEKNLLDNQTFLNAKKQRWRELQLELISFKTAMLFLSLFSFLILSIISLIGNANALMSFQGIASVLSPLLMSGLKTIQSRTKNPDRPAPEEL